jgi:hypothetical protein
MCCSCLLLKPRPGLCLYIDDQVVALAIWLLSYVLDWLHELELGARYVSCTIGCLIVTIYVAGHSTNLFIQSRMLQLQDPGLISLADGNALFYCIVSSFD